MEEKISELKAAAVAEVKAASDMTALNDIRVKYLGKKG
jgi:phenylalanyl-tRNA synthetase alpha chain